MVRSRRRVDRLRPGAERAQTKGVARRFPYTAASTTNSRTSHVNVVMPSIWFISWRLSRNLPRATG
eukprot:1076435-Heterocapsa_arctica.AAC.1